MDNIIFMAYIDRGECYVNCLMTMSVRETLAKRIKITDDKVIYAEYNGRMYVAYGYKNNGFEMREITPTNDPYLHKSITRIFDEYKEETVKL